MKIILDITRYQKFLRQPIIIKPVVRNSLLKLSVYLLSLVFAFTAGVISTTDVRNRETSVSIPLQVVSEPQKTIEVVMLEATVNAVRQENNLSALTPNPTLNAAALAKCTDMLVKNYWNHNSPGGDEPWDFITRSGHSYRSATENLAFGMRTAEQTVNGWMNSEGHRANILNTEVNEMGHAVCRGDFQGQPDQQIIVQMFTQS